ncbi:protein of unknown function (DUF3846) [Parafrankia irregularis]|uniref:DUF3846 domain-containing protein n=1 Tax=Parafrankia irregularis TaxID=795642 RepID=A0A0S4QZ45_9ACTN|nr:MULTISPECIES: DUF3846 domain-containing protein [Frankiaceae]MBE3204726.1 DUF3846 domain-containing protein [Parafrankia sp. CH37]CUU60869.1 protein of unknown function (DUF3846) [Parafrankia irregularis]
MIRVLTVPADPEAPHALIQMSPTDLRGFQTLVGGSIERVDLADVGSLWANEDGLRLCLGLNERATALAAFHAPRFGWDLQIVGDTYVTGPVDADGLDTDVPDTLVGLLTAEQVRLEVRRSGGDWADNGTHPGLLAAYAAVWEKVGLLADFKPGSRFAVRALPVGTAAGEPTAGSVTDGEAVWTVWGDRVDPYAVRQTRQQAQAAVDKAAAEGDAGVYAAHPDGTTLTPTPTR